MSLKQKWKNMHHHTKKLIVLCTVVLMIILIIFFVLRSCRYKYKGDYPKLYTVAIHSILGANGSSPGEWLAFPPYLELWEEDEFGRQSFIYCEGNIYYLLISQTSDEKYVFFYPNYNFIGVDVSESYPDRPFGYITVDEPKNIFSNESIKQLKEKNDWNLPIIKDKCIKIAITREKDEPKIWNKKKDKEKAFEGLCEKIANESGCKGNDSVFRFSVYCVSDDYGRALFYAYGIHRDVNGEGISPNSKVMYFDIVMIFNPDGTNGNAMKLKTLYDYQDELKAFKENNNWNKPL